MPITQLLGNGLKSLTAHTEEHIGTKGRWELKLYPAPPHPRSIPATSPSKAHRTESQNHRITES